MKLVASTVGVLINGARPSTKKAVVEAVRSAPDEVYFGYIRADELQEGEFLTFVGPDPNRNRSWFGELRRTPRGLKIS